MQNRTIYGTDRDTINDRDHLTSGEVERLKAAGVELDAREKRVLQAMADQAFARARMTEHRATLARLDAESDAAARSAREARNVYSTRAPSSDDDYFVICDASELHFPFYVEPPSGRDQAQLIFGGGGFMAAHWVKREAAETAISLLSQRRLPYTYVWQWTPADLMDAVRFKGTWTSPNVSQRLVGRTADGVLQLVDEQPEMNWTGILKLCSNVVAGCSHLPTLRTWLASAETKGGDHYQAFAAKLRDRLAHLEAAQAESQAAE